MNVKKIKWETPDPSIGLRNERHAAFRAALKAKPGKWAILIEGASQSYAGVARRTMLWKGFELTQRHDGKGRWRVYARFVGANGKK